MFKKFTLFVGALLVTSMAFAQESDEVREVQVPTDSLGVHPWDGQENDNHIIIPNPAHWSMYLSAGFNVTDADFTSEKKHAVWVPTIGLGAAYHWNNTWSLGLEYKFRNYRVTGTGDEVAADVLLKGMSHQANAYVALDIFNMFRPQNKAKLFAFDVLLGGGALWFKNSIQYPNIKKATYEQIVHSDFEYTFPTGTSGNQQPTKMDKYKLTGALMLGASAEFNLNRSFQLGLRGVYFYTTTDQVDNRVRPENNDGFFDCEIILRYKFEPRKKSNVRNYMVDQQIANWNDGTYYEDPAMGAAKRDKYQVAPQKDTVFTVTRDTVYMMPATASVDNARRGIRDYVVFFENDVPELDQMALSITGDAAMLLQAEPDYKAVVVGSCDNTGAVEYNKWLAVQRATNVKQTLMDMGVDSTRIYFAGRGIMQDDRDLGSFGPNRRVEIHIVTDEQMEQAKEEYAYFEQYKSVKKGSAVRQANEGQHASSSEALKSAIKTMKETGKIQQLGEAFKALMNGKTEEKSVAQPDAQSQSEAAGLIQLMKQAVQAGVKEAQSAPAVECDTIVVAPNMTLGLLAKKYYGDGHLWVKIYEANRDKLASPDQIQEGMTLLIPKL